MFVAPMVQMASVAQSNYLSMASRISNLSNYFVIGEDVSTLAETGSDSVQSFVQSIITAITTNINLTMIASVIAIIISGGIVSIFAWKFARKGYNFIKNALSGKQGSW